MTGPDYLRVGDTERDEVAVALHDHFVQGRLTRDELDERLELTLSAKTVGDLREITRDLPGPHRPAETHRPAPHTWHAGHHPHRRRHHFLMVPPMLLGCLVIAAVMAAPMRWAFFGAARVVLLIWLAGAVFGILRHRRWHRRAGQRPMP